MMNGRSFIYLFVVHYFWHLSDRLQQREEITLINWLSLVMTYAAPRPTSWTDLAVSSVTDSCSETFKTIVVVQCLTAGRCHLDVDKTDSELSQGVVLSNFGTYIHRLDYRQTLIIGVALIMHSTHVRDIKEKFKQAT